MGKGKRTRARRRAANAASGGDRSPQVNIELASADMDLSTATVLVKPAVLYGDSVTVFSPCASMLKHAKGLADLSGSQRVALMLEVIQGVPNLRNQLDCDDETLKILRTLFASDTATRRRLTRALPRAVQTSLKELIDPDSATWRDMESAVQDSVDQANATELLAAVDAGVVGLEDVWETGTPAVVADSVRAASEAGTSSGEIDAMMDGFLARLVDMIGSPGRFPLLDPDAADLLRALRNEALVIADRSTVRRSTEVTAATSFMGFLPSFPDLPMDEVISLRGELKEPLARFRSEMARLARDFESEPPDRDFPFEVEDVWRSRVEPVLSDVREALAEHGLLREAASVARGDPSRLITEAGAVFAAGHTLTSSLSTAMCTALALAVPTAGVALRALEASSKGKRTARSSSMYFLHKLGEEAQARAA